MMEIGQFSHGNEDISSDCEENASLIWGFNEIFNSNGNMTHMCQSPDKLVHWKFWGEYRERMFVGNVTVQNC